MLRACLVICLLFLTSLPAGARIGYEGWTLSKPPYPRSLKLAGVQGVGGVRVVTDATGRVVVARMEPGIHPRLDAICIAHAKKEWRGPAKVTRVVPVSFVLGARVPPRR